MAGLRVPLTSKRIINCFSQKQITYQNYYISRENIADHALRLSHLKCASIRLDFFKEIFGRFKLYFSDRFWWLKGGSKMPYHESLYICASWQNLPAINLLLPNTVQLYSSNSPSITQHIPWLGIDRLPAYAPCLDEVDNRLKISGCCKYRVPMSESCRVSNPNTQSNDTSFIWKALFGAALAVSYSYFLLIFPDRVEIVLVSRGS